MSPAQMRPKPTCGTTNATSIAIVKIASTASDRHDHGENGVRVGREPMGGYLFLRHRA